VNTFVLCLMSEQGWYRPETPAIMNVTKPNIGLLAADLGKCVEPVYSAVKDLLCLPFGKQRSGGSPESFLLSSYHQELSIPCVSALPYVIVLSMEDCLSWPLGYRNS